MEKPVLAVFAPNINAYTGLTGLDANGEIQNPCVSKFRVPFIKAKPTGSIQPAAVD